MSRPASIRVLLVIALAVGATIASSGIARATWPADPTVNVAISRMSHEEQHAIAVSDGADGAIVIYERTAGGAFGIDLHAQRVNADGAIVWSSPVNVSSEVLDQRDAQAIADGSGGVIIVWCDTRGGATVGDIYAQRIDAGGNAQWAYDGRPICTAENVQAYPQLVADGAGGAIVAWRDSRNYYFTSADIYAQRVNANGTPLWASDGVPICSAPANQMEPAITTDGAGGAIIAWMDDRDAESGTNIYFQKVNAAGVTQWTANGIGYLAYGNQRWLPLNSPLVSDGAGGAIVAWHEDYAGENDHDIRALRVDASGDFPWYGHNLYVCGASGNQFLRGCAGDGLGNMVITWRDDRYGLPDSDIFGQLIDAAGTMHWPAWSAAICNTSDPQEDSQVVLDDTGGAVVTWTDERSGFTDIYAQRMSATGERMWLGTGVPICSEAHSQHSPAMAPAGPCGAIVAWTDYRWVGDPYNDTSFDIYGQRVYCDGSLSQFIHVDVPNGGEVWAAGTRHDIRWRCAGISNRDVLVEYSTDGGETYRFVAYVTQIGTVGSHSWLVPNTPAPGCRVRLSLWVPEGTVVDESDGYFAITPGGSGIEDRPAPAMLAFEPLSPNPARGPVALSFGLPSAARVELRLYDVSGRLVRVLLDDRVEAGWRRLLWDRRTQSGSPAPRGVYSCVLTVPGAEMRQKLVLLD